MAKRYFIEACNEPRGEGNGWDLCTDSEAKCFMVWEVTDGLIEECISTFLTRNESEKYIGRIIRESVNGMGKDDR